MAKALRTIFLFQAIEVLLISAPNPKEVHHDVSHECQSCITERGGVGISWYRKSTHIRQVVLCSLTPSTSPEAFTMSFHTMPYKATLKPKPFQAHVSDSELNDFKQLLELSKIGPKTYENQFTDVKDIKSWGISRQWVEDAKKHWETKYDWRKTEERINKQPNFTATIEDSGFQFEIHFAALFSKKADAAPLLVMHGWPGSFLEILSTLELLQKKYTPENLPFHIIVPSLPGYGYSNGPPLDKNYDMEGIARVMDKLMIGLGFGDGYIAQGGDVGSFITRILGATAPACKVAHLHLCTGTGAESEEDIKKLSKEEKEGLERMKEFGWLGNAYAREHGTRPSTIGLALSASPIALLSWYAIHLSFITRLTPHDPLLTTPSQDRREIPPMVRHLPSHGRDPRLRHTLLVHRVLPALHLHLPLLVRTQPLLLPQQPAQILHQQAAGLLVAS
jgi:pimeloyl-ACP methyl ester carboxylesterase